LVTIKLQKLKITAYSSDKRSGAPDGTFEAMFNPQSYSLKYVNVYQKFQGIDTDGREAHYSLSKPHKLSVTLLLDGTGATDYGVMQLAKSKDIYKEVQQFLQMTCYMDEQLHQPKYLKVEWGDLNFDCRLASVEIKYTLFNRSGQPLRAELNTEFEGDVQPSKRTMKESADLTHVTVITSSDTLPLLAARVYNNPSYYIQIALANGLNNFRRLEPGKTLSFPPMEK
jgi:hypothetical protein